MSPVLGSKKRVTSRLLMGMPSCKNAVSMVEIRFIISDIVYIAETNFHGNYYIKDEC